MKKCKIVKSEELLATNSSKILAEWFVRNKIKSIVFTRGTFLDLILLEKQSNSVNFEHIGYFQYGSVNVINEYGARKYGFTYYTEFIYTTKSSGKCYLKKLRLLRLKLLKKLENLFSTFVRIIMFPM